jgi:G3E family GTPase
MSEARRQPVTVNLLTGFLGSGKTSLLRRLLKQPELADVAVLINEFGEVGLDHLLLDKVDDDIVLLQSGCVCCTIRGDLKEAMLRLHGRLARGEIPPVSRLVIETTGLADPAPIVATLLADPVLRHHFQLGNVVTLVDGVTGAETLRRQPVSLKQAAVADRLVVSKTDLCDSVADLTAELRRLNPAASILEASEAEPAPVSLLLDDIHDERAKSAEVARWLEAEAQSGSHGHSHGAVASICLVAETPIDWAGFGLWLSMLLNRHGDRVLRLKGLINVAGLDTPVVVHGVQHLVHKPLHLSAWPDGDSRTRIVVIAEGLELEQLRRSFGAFLAFGRSRTAPGVAAQGSQEATRALMA